MITPTPEPVAHRLRAIAARFAIDPPIGEIQPLGRGLINDTFSLEAGGRRYVLQRLNATVFPDPDQIMANLSVFSAHLAGRESPGLRIPALIRGRDGASCARDAAGQVWRLMEFIPDAVTLERVESEVQACEVGAILGRFHRMADELSCDGFGFSLPGFHATPAYLARLLDRVSQSDRGHFTPDIRDSIDWVIARQGLARVLADAHLAGLIPQRITHGDPKLDNILFDRDGRRALALIDLDTVQPGLIQHDLGDCLRSCCNRSGEGAIDGDSIHFDLEIGAGILAGYASETRGLLTPEDIALLYDAIRLMPFELGLRFLTDHLEGDRYFRVSERGQNLRKARIQFALVEDIERQEEAIRAWIAAAF